MSHMEQDWIIDEDAFVVTGVLTERQCAELAAVAEDEGFDLAPINTRHGVELVPEVRNNTRVIFDRDDWAEFFWGRFRHLELPYLNHLPACGINERFRAYRYEPGQRFAPHYDGCYRRPDGSELSGWSILIYLNGGYEGGQTRFLPPDPLLEVVPEAGMALFFRHDTVDPSFSLGRDWSGSTA